MSTPTEALLVHIRLGCATPDQLSCADFGSVEYHREYHRPEGHLGRARRATTAATEFMVHARVRIPDFAFACINSATFRTSRWNLESIETARDGI